MAVDSIDPPAEHDGMYPRGALLAADYSVPILWLSLFNTDGLVTWPGIHGSTFTAVALEDWSRLAPWEGTGQVRDQVPSHEAGWRSQIRIEATSTVPRQM